MREKQNKGHTLTNSPSLSEDIVDNQVQLVFVMHDFNSVPVSFLQKDIFVDTMYSFKNVITQKVAHEFEILCTYAHHRVESGNLVVGILQHGVDILSAVQNEEGWLLFSETVAHDGSQTTFALFKKPDSNCYFAFFVETQELFDF